MGGIGAAAALTAGTDLFSQQTPIQAKKLNDRLWVLMGDGGNVAVLTSHSGLFMVDGGLPERGEDLLHAVAEHQTEHAVKEHAHA